MVERANGGEARGDEELLAGYVEAGSEAAFRGLVERYGGLVFHTAMRVTGDHELAEEAVQNTFSVLAKRARSVKGAGGLAGWLHRTAWYEAKNLRRAETRRGRKMKAYAEEGEGMEASEEDEGEGDESWREALPFLDGALERLGAKDRMVLLLHYFEGLSYGEVAERVGGVSGAGAQKRGVRALAKLGRLLRARGCVLSGVAVGSMLGVELAKAAPVGLSAKVVAGALSGVTAGAGGGGFVGMLLGGGAGKVQVAGGVAVAAILLTPIVVQQVAIVEARGRIEALEKEIGVGGMAGQELLVGQAPDLVDGLSGGKGSGTGGGGDEEARFDLVEMAEDLARAEMGDISAILRVTDAAKSMGRGGVVGVLERISEVDVVESKRILLANFLLNELGGHSPAEAVLLGVELLSEFSEQESRMKLAETMGRSLRVWALSHPEEALTWFRENEKGEAFADVSLNEDGEVRFGMLYQAYPGFAMADAELALDLLRGEDTVDAATLISGVGFEHGNLGLQMALARYAMKLEEPHDRVALVGLFSGMKDIGRAAMADFVDGMEVADSDKRAELFVLVAEPWKMGVTRGQVEDTMGWLEGRVGAEAILGAKVEYLAEVGRHAPSVAQELMEEIRDGEANGDHLTAQFVRTANRSSFQGTDALIDVAAGIGDVSTRQQMLVEIYRTQGDIYPAKRDAMKKRVAERAGFTPRD